MLEVMNWTYNAEADAEEAGRKKINPKFERMVHAFSSRAKAPSYLTRQEEYAAILEWQTTQSTDIMSQLLEAYNDFISAIAVRICRQHGRNDLMSDAWSHGCELFITACKKFDATQGARISTFAKYHIVGGLHKLLTDLRTPVRTMTNYWAKKVMYNYASIRAMFQHETGRQLTTTPEDIKIASRLTGIPEGPLKRGIRAREMSIIPAHMIHLPMQESEGFSVQQEDMMRGILARELNSLQDVLSKRDFAIVRQSFLAELSGNKDLMPIADDHSLTVERIRQIYRDGRNRIRDSLKRQGIASFSEAV